MIASGRLVPIGRAEDVPRLEARTVTVAGRRIAVYHTPAGYRATDADCPHRGGPLADGREPVGVGHVVGLMGDGCVTCPLHGWRFDLGTGEAVGQDARVAVHAVVERDGWLYLAPPG